MRKLIAAVFLLLLTLSFSLFPGEILAQDSKNDSEVVDVYALFWPIVPGKTVSDPLFFLKQIKERFDGFFKSGEVAKSGYTMELAEKRLVESAKLLENKDYANAKKSLDMNESSRNEAVDLKRKALEKNQDISGLSPKLVKSLEKQQKALTFLATQFSADQQEKVSEMADSLTLQISEAK